MRAGLQTMAKYAGSLVLAVALLAGCAERSTLWEEYSQDGLSAYSVGQYEEAESFFNAALEEAERTGKVDERLATSLNNLATAYTALDRYGGSEALYRRALAIRKAQMAVVYVDCFGHPAILNFRLSPMMVLPWMRSS